MKTSNKLFAVINTTIAVVLIFMLCGCNYSILYDAFVEDEGDNSYNYDEIKVEIGREISMTLPCSAVIQKYEDTHGGFLGDGVTDAVIKLNEDAETDEFVEDIKKTWLKPPFENYELKEILRNCDIYSNQSYVFYRDRYYEEYGEYTSNSYNYTLATFDEETMTLYYRVLDT